MQWASEGKAKNLFITFIMKKLSSTKKIDI